MTEQLPAQDIIRSAESLAIVSGFATGESDSMFEAARLMPEYRGLIISYARYCMNTLRDRRVAAYLPDDFHLATGGYGPHIYVLLDLSGEAPEFKTNFGSNLTGGWDDDQETIDKITHSFEENIIQKHSPLEADPQEINWDFIHNIEEVKVTNSTSGQTRLQPRLKHCLAIRDFDPIDFIAYPFLLESFVRKIDPIITEAAQTILLSDSHNLENVSQRARELVDALQRANEILAPVLESQEK